MDFHTDDRKLFSRVENQPFKERSHLVLLLKKQTHFSQAPIKTQSVNEVIFRTSIKKTERQTTKKDTSINQGRD